MQFREVEYMGFTIRLCDLPPTPLYDNRGRRVGAGLKNRHWKVRRNGVTVTTAQTLTRAKEKVRALHQKELILT